MTYVSKNGPITEAIQMIAGAWNGDPAVKAQQQAFELEQARTDAYLQKSEADIADMNAKLALQKELNAGQINQYSAAADKYRADAANALLERDGLAAQLDSRKKYEEGLGSALAPEPTQMDIGGPLNAKAAGPVQIPKGTPLPPTPQQFASRLAKNAPAMFASGMNPDQAANAVLLMSTLGANAGIVPPDQQEAFNRNALIGTGKMPDLNTALTTGRQNEVINLNAKNDQALEKVKNQSAPGGKPLPVGALKVQDGLLEDIGIASNIQTDLRSVVNQIDTGALSLSPIGNVGSEVVNFLGRSTEGSRNYDSFKRTLEKLRNDSLRLNKGVQTEGDSIRAWNEILTNMNDQNLVRERLLEVEALNQRAATLKQVQIDTLRSNYGAAPFDTTAIQNPIAAIGAGTPQASVGTVEGEEPPTQEDFEYTAQQWGVSVEEVKQRLGIQ